MRALAARVTFAAVPKRRASRVRHALARAGTLAADVAQAGMTRWTPELTRVAQETQRELDALGCDLAARALGDVLAHAGARPARPAGPVVAPSPFAVAGGARPAAAQHSPPRKPRSLYAAVVAPPSASAAAPPVPAPEADPHGAPRAFDAWDTPRPAPSVRAARALLKLALLAQGAASYPDGPAPRDAIEPLLRHSLDPRARPVLRGRVLVPLVASAAPRWLAFDLGARALVDVAAPGADMARTLLVRRLVLDHGRPVPGALANGVTPGTPVGAAADRRVLACAEGALSRVLASLLAQRADPFARGPAPVLVGPLTRVASDPQPGSGTLADAHGARCAVARTLPGADLFYLLATPGARGASLALDPLLVWRSARGRSGERIALHGEPAEPVAPPREPLLAEALEVLLELFRTGLARGVASRDAARDLTGPLAREGFGGLAAELAALCRDPGREGARLFAGIHLIDRLMGGPVSVR